MSTKNKNTEYLSMDDILSLHVQLIEEFGGLHGIRDAALLESSVFRTQLTFGGEDLYKTIFEKAAALMHGIISKHPFIDGNKRTGMASGLVFLDLNGHTIEVSDVDVERVSLQIANKEWGIAEIQNWLSTNSHS